eukprot:COSAG06_NODE_16793_length_980_cov_1.938706_1_plen_280_part_10
MDCRTCDTAESRSWVPQKDENGINTWDICLEPNSTVASAPGIGCRHQDSKTCSPFKPDIKVCFNQQWLDDSDDRFLFDHDTSIPLDKPTIARWCAAHTPESKCTYRVAKERTTTCMLPFWVPPIVQYFQPTDGLGHNVLVGCIACGGSLPVHLLTFWANLTFSFAVVSRLYRCYEDYYIQYHRMLYFIQLTPWSTMKHVYRGQHSNTVKQKHEHWGLLPTWDLDCTANIVAWNKLRIFLQAYEVRSSRRVQISVVYLLLAWLVACVYQAVKAYLRRGDEV